MADAAMMKGKRGLVMGVANDHSIAWGIARHLAAHGAEIAFSYQGDAQLRRLKPLADSIGSKLLLPCDVENDNQMDAVFDVLKRECADFAVMRALAMRFRGMTRGGSGAKSIPGSGMRWKAASTRCGVSRAD